MRYRGIRVGKVKEISINPDAPREIHVRIDIPERFPVTAATRARLSYLGVTGLALIDLDDDGSDPAPLRAGEQGPARIPLGGSQFDALGSQATDTMAVLRQVLLRVNALFDDRNIERISGVLANVQSATAHLDKSLAGLPAVLAEARQTFERTQAVLSSQNVERLSGILASVEQTSGETRRAAEDLRALLGSMKQLADRIDALTTVAGQQVTDDTLPRLQNLIDEVQRNSRQLNRMLGELESSPQTLLLGRETSRAGPGEAGFAPATEGVVR
ncbi:MAG: mammalian cell entry protein [Methyloversatilis sp. 12-65-5]|nr:MAG: mammalian cell entry protein [Methyloversatilis sp. 12-65-5]